MSAEKKGYKDDMEIPISVLKKIVKKEETIEVEPEIFIDGTSQYKLDKTCSSALVIHCGDPRFQTAFHQFITLELGISNYTPLIIGGGIHAFGMQTFLPKNFKIIWEQIKFFIKEGKLNQIIIINHEDCRWYSKMKGYYGSLSLPLKGKQDLKSAALTILRDFSGVNVRTFWAGLDGDNILFTVIK